MCKASPCGNRILARPYANQRGAEVTNSRIVRYHEHPIDESERYPRVHLKIDTLLSLPSVVYLLHHSTSGGSACFVVLHFWDTTTNVVLNEVTTCRGHSVEASLSTQVCIHYIGPNLYLRSRITDEIVDYPPSAQPPFFFLSLKGTSIPLVISSSPNTVPIITYMARFDLYLLVPCRQSSTLPLLPLPMRFGARVSLAASIPFEKRSPAKPSKATPVLRLINFES